jgi:hypothetical protein
MRHRAELIFISDIFANMNSYSKRLYPVNQGTQGYYLILKKTLGSKISDTVPSKEMWGGKHNYCKFVNKPDMALIQNSCLSSEVKIRLTNLISSDVNPLLSFFLFLRYTQLLEDS